MKIRCPECEEVFRAREGGGTVDCPACGAELQLPGGPARAKRQPAARPPDKPRPTDKPRPKEKVVDDTPLPLEERRQRRTKLPPWLAPEIVLGLLIAVLLFGALLGAVYVGLRVAGISIPKVSIPSIGLIFAPDYSRLIPPDSVVVLALQPGSTNLEAANKYLSEAGFTGVFGQSSIDPKLANCRTIVFFMSPNKQNGVLFDFYRSVTAAKEFQHQTSEESTHESFEIRRAGLGFLARPTSTSLLLLGDKQALIAALDRSKSPGTYPAQFESNFLTIQLSQLAQFAPAGLSTLLSSEMKAGLDAIRMIRIAITSLGPPSQVTLTVELTDEQKAEEIAESLAILKTIASMYSVGAHAKLAAILREMPINRSAGLISTSFSVDFREVKIGNMQQMMTEARQNLQAGIGVRGLAFRVKNPNITASSDTATRVAELKRFRMELELLKALAAANHAARVQQITAASGADKIVRIRVTNARRLTEEKILSNLEILRADQDVRAIAWDAALVGVADALEITVATAIDPARLPSMIKPQFSNLIWNSGTRTYECTYVE